ncbi:hypothetical protein BJF96_g8592 [Verticillium dahliae]|uniref:Uncharacterized protein n=1 Tax=Verticillium dahliae TaxID=27337 RepID=A0AA45AIE1_VERDA|nr:hypothetical protein BJF96_g8592 [Verticillium dahliae]PNH51830.1 hypothetical protein VD0003_g5453 [Verticillium dahliae]
MPTTQHVYNARLDVKHAHIFAMTMCEPINESTHRACGSDSRFVPKRFLDATPRPYLMTTAYPFNYLTLAKQSFRTGAFAREL